jgi:hypothetical protein
LALMQQTHPVRTVLLAEGLARCRLWPPLDGGDEECENS